MLPQTVPSKISLSTYIRIEICAYARIYLFTFSVENRITRQAETEEKLLLFIILLPISQN